VRCENSVKVEKMLSQGGKSALRIVEKLTGSRGVKGGKPGLAPV
jgi:hypothetical protein